MLFGPLRLYQLGFFICIEIDQSETRAGLSRESGLQQVQWSHFGFGVALLFLSFGNCSPSGFFSFCAPDRLRLVAANFC